MTQQEMHVVIRGRVQGVGFRAEAKFLAQQLKVTGYARNCPDGTVEILAQGTKSTLERFLEELKKAFGRHIAECQVTFRHSKEEFDQFSIRL